MDGKRFSLFPLFLAAAAIVFASAGCGGSKDPTPPPPGPFKIIFYSNRDGKQGMYKMDADGQNVELILEVGDSFKMAVLSHDHRRIAYIENSIIYIVDLEGNPLKTIDPGENRRPATYVNWSPDDACLVFGGPSSTQRMYTTNIATGEITDIGMGKNPDWGPGDRIVYYTTALNTLVPGESPVTLKDDNGNSISGSYPSWSPTGDRISYLDLSATSRALKVIEADGGEPLGVTTGSIYFNNIWTADGQYIIYMAYDTSEEGGDAEIWKVKADGSESAQKLTDNNCADMLLFS